MVVILLMIVFAPLHKDVSKSLNTNSVLSLLSRNMSKAKKWMVQLLQLLSPVDTAPGTVGIRELGDFLTGYFSPWIVRASHASAPERRARQFCQACALDY